MACRKSTIVLAISAIFMLTLLMSCDTVQGECKRKEVDTKLPCRNPNICREWCYSGLFTGGGHCHIQGDRSFCVCV
uniref:Uncharacterized protein n=1 Tax=Triticum urartu TaxID=4572 RepID=A0A8R7V8Y9_TRIUA